MATKSATAKITLKVTTFILRLLLNIVFYLLVIILIINASKAVFGFTYQLYGPVSAEKAPGTDITIQIQKGESTMDVASKLELNLAIKDKYAFYVKTKLEKSVIMPGTYVINSSMTYDDILAIVTDLSASVVKEEDDTATDPGTTTETEAGTKSDTSEESDTNAE